MDKTNLNQIIGILLIFLILFYWAKINAPTEAELAEQQRIRDSIQLAVSEAESTTTVVPTTTTNPITAGVPDSLVNMQNLATYGIFAPAASGQEQSFSLENELIQIRFTNKGGRISEVILKEYEKSKLDSQKVVQKEVLKLLEDAKNKFEYFLPVSQLTSGGIRTGNLYFTPTLNGNELIFRANAGNGKYFEQRYTLSENGYDLDYNIRLVGLDNEVDGGNVQLSWINYLDRIEENTSYERNFSSAYYYTVEEDMDYCSCTTDATESPEERIKWISHSNQFFNSSLIAKESSFKKAVLSTEMMPEKDEDLKKLTTSLQIPMESGSFAMSFYLGPNDYNLLRAQGNSLEDIIPFGSSIFGTINRWVIRPLFGFLSQFISNKGIVIIIMVLLVKLALFPFTYKMVYSQQKMAALKPRISKMREKFKDDQQAQQMEMMKLYREYGVNPLGGCLPIAAQMPIWFALFRFFPAAIEFRQQPFLWAHDLSSFDVLTWLPYEIPFYGSHISLLTVLWAGVTVLYTVYNSKQMDMSAMGGAGGQQQKMMMYMQYFMPIMFLFFFNNYAAGLTTYMFTSTLINVSQMVFTKQVLIDKEKIERELVAYQKKPKKKGGFSERLAKAMKEQQKIQSQKEAGKKRRKR